MVATYVTALSNKTTIQNNKRTLKYIIPYILSTAPKRNILITHLWIENVNNKYKKKYEIKLYKFFIKFFSCAFYNWKEQNYSAISLDGKVYVTIYIPKTINIYSG